MAIATAPGRGAIGVVRASGRWFRRSAPTLTGKLLPARMAVYAPFRDASGAVLDEGLALYFPGPHSYTGEDVLELQGHGGSAVLAATLSRCVELGARIAEPGEFTRRAFLNGKLDLAQAEAVADLIEATNRTAARSAMRSLRGEFSQRVEQLHRSLTELRALAEASLDFPEDDDMHALHASHAMEQLAQVREAVEAVRRAAKQGSLLREGVQVAIVGPPNVGKSSLLNRLAGEDIAIVTDIPGTTRDALRATVSIEGVPFHFSIRRGLRTAADPVEAIGIARGQELASRADIVLVMAESGRAFRDTSVAGQRVLVENKIDLYDLESGIDRAGTDIRVRVSAQSGERNGSVACGAAGGSRMDPTGRRGCVHGTRTASSCAAGSREAS